MSNLDVDMREDLTKSLEYKSKGTLIDIGRNDTEQTSIISEDCGYEENNPNSPKPDCAKPDKELPEGETNDEINCKARSRKRTSSNISDILNLGDENSNDAASENDAIVSDLKHSPVKRNSEKDKHRSGSKKHRSGSRRFRKRKWKPYCKLTWQEQQKVHERDARRAQRIRNNLSALGIPLAPDNTNEFLIKDQMISSPDYDEIYENKPGVSYIDKDFEEEYEYLREQYFTNLSKNDLVQSWIEREDKIEALEKQLNTIREQKKSLGISKTDIDSGMAKIEVFEKEIKNLSLENYKLFGENERLKKLITEHHL